MYKDLKLSDIKEGIVYVSANELAEMVGGIPKSSMANYIHTDVIDGYRYRNRTFFLPDDVAEFVLLYKAGLLKRRRK